MSVVVGGGANVSLVWVSVRRMPAWKRRWWWVREGVLGLRVPLPLPCMGVDFVRRRGTEGGDLEGKWVCSGGVVVMIPAWRIVTEVGLLLVGFVGAGCVGCVSGFIQTKGWEGACGDRGYLQR